MEWYSKLYVSDTAKKKKSKIIRKLKTNAGLLNVYVITLSANRQNLLEIIAASYIKQAVVYRNLPMIVGIACSYEEALELVSQIVEETYQQTGAFNVSKYLKDRQ